MKLREYDWVAYCVIATPFVFLITYFIFLIMEKIK